jgi:hypothetical protein
MTEIVALILKYLVDMCHAVSLQETRKRTEKHTSMEPVVGPTVKSRMNRELTRGKMLQTKRRKM